MLPRWLACRLEKRPRSRKQYNPLRGIDAIFASFPRISKSTPKSEGVSVFSLHANSPSTEPTARRERERERDKRRTFRINRSWLYWLAKPRAKETQRGSRHVDARAIIISSSSTLNRLSRLLLPHLYKNNNKGERERERKNNGGEFFL